MVKVIYNPVFLKAASEIHRPLSLKNIVKRFMFMLAVRRHASAINYFCARLDSIGVPITSEMLETIVAPYIHNEWDVLTKFNAIAAHYEILQVGYPKLSQINILKQRLHVCDLSHASPDVAIQIDFVSWFKREGELAINIFKADLRVATMAFTLAVKEEEIVAYIGVVQGIHSGIPAVESLEIYKVLTKAFAGLRPRSLLLEVLKVVVNKLGAKKIFGISEQNRHHRHKYFGNDQSTKFLNNYNDFWNEHNSIFNQDIGFYEVPMKSAIKDISDVKSKKRSQYKRRNQLVASLEDIINLNGLILP